MSSASFEKSVKGGTKIKLAPPKSKYVEHILVATQAGDAGVAEIFRTLPNRLRDSTWTIVFKGLIIVHLMIREGEPNVTLKYLADQPSKLAISNFSDVQIQGGNIRHYHNYILSRGKAYRDTKIDWVREGQGRLKKVTIDKGLLRETEIVQKQIGTLLKCDLLSNDVENEITLTAFRLLTMDLLVLYSAMNEGTINVLEHYFEMSKSDAERALSIYKTFSKQTNEVVEFLGVARQYENATRLEIPKLKHAPTSLTASLEEYLTDPDFEINRRQFMAQIEAKKGGKFTKKEGSSSTDPTQKSNLNKGASTSTFADSKPFQAPAPKQEPKGPAPDLIDLFGSIEQNQQPMIAQPQQQISNFQPIPQYQFQQLGFSGQQNIQGHQNQPASSNGVFDSTNPFGQLAAQQQQQARSNTAGGPFGPFNPQAQSPLEPMQQFNPSPDQINQFVAQHPFQQPSLQSGASFGPGSQPPFNPGGQPQQQSPFHNGTQALQPQSTNPFRQSVMPLNTNSLPPAFSGSTFVASPDQQSTNPFARNLGTQQAGLNQGSPFTSPPPGSVPTSTTSTFFSQQPMFSPQQQSSQLPQASQPLQPNRTGTNPFARSAPQSQIQTPMISPLAPQATGTNPFRQSAFINQQTGQGWQATQGTMGGLEKLDTIPVFPRPVQPQQQVQQPWP